MGTHMTDQKALEILRRTGIENIEEYCEAIAIASNRLLDCQCMKTTSEIELSYGLVRS